MREDCNQSLNKKKNSSPSFGNGEGGRSQTDNKWPAFPDRTRAMAEFHTGKTFRGPFQIEIRFMRAKEKVY